MQAQETALKQQQTDQLLTVAVVVWNRDWVIGKMLNSLQQQTYPHSKIFVLMVDNESTDDTVPIAKQILEKADFAGYRIIIQKCNIAEGRNLYIDNMVGDRILFWDSDVVMEPTSTERLMADMDKPKQASCQQDTSNRYFLGQQRQ